MRKLIAISLAFWYGLAAANAQIITGSVPNTFVNGTVIDATQVNANNTYITNQVNANGAKNGTNSDITALTALTTPVVPAAGGSTNFIGTTVGGTANAVTVTVSLPSISTFSLTNGYQVTFTVSSTNTGATTLAVGGTAATAIVKQIFGSTTPLVGGELIAGQKVTVIYDGTSYQLVTNPSDSYSFGPLTAITGGATTDLSTLVTHNVNINGTGLTITSFGSPAVANMLYLFRWNGTNTISSGVAINLLGSATSRSVVSGDQQLWLWNGSSWFELAIFNANPRYSTLTANQLVVKNNAVTPNTKVDITAAEVVMDSAGSANFYTDNYGSCTIDATIVGAAGLDAGTLAANTWYNIFTISTGVTLSCLASTSATTPTMPTGYAYKMRVGALKTDAANNFLRITQRGRNARYAPDNSTNNTTLPALAGPTTTGNCGSATLSLTAVTNVFNSSTGLIPPTAIGITAEAVAGANNGAIMISPVNATSTFCTQCGMIMFNPGTGSPQIITGDLYNETGSNSLYWCAAVSATIRVFGWIDAINAN